ncbi:MAG: DUF2452 domain-containing protein [Gammaproteobacteria bacterium]|nr:DUF2452 domain-containing protein [Gammaproteobacteria bacterium]
MAKNPNPQGKGLVAVLSDLDARKLERSALPKNIDQVSSELFTSLFVLRSKFRFNPVVGEDYWLYRVSNEFQLFMLGPDDWPGGHPGQLIGACTLQDDMTWTIALDSEAAADEGLMEYLRVEQEAFSASLDQADTVEDVLPVFEGELPYFQRVLAFGLGRSLGSSMVNAGIAQLSYRQAKGLLAAPDRGTDSEAE